jgi:hypothetical protein
MQPDLQTLTCHISRTIKVPQAADNFYATYSHQQAAKLKSFKEPTMKSKLTFKIPPLKCPASSTISAKVGSQNDIRGSNKVGDKCKRGELTFPFHNLLTELGFRKQ